MAYNPASQGMGLTNVGIGGAGVVFKRKFRWTLEIKNQDNSSNSFSVEPYFVKIAARPSVTFESTEINFLNEKTFIPGKPTWEPISVTFLDSNKGSGADLISWLSSLFDFNTPSSKKMASKVQDYTGILVLTLYDGCGQPMEVWTLGDAWPESINFGDLDMGSSEIAEIQVTFRYSQVSYKSKCGKQPASF